MSNRKRRTIEDVSQQSQQAKQEHEVVEDEMNIHELSEGSGEDLMQNMEQDYKVIEELDRYEPQGIDDQQLQMDQNGVRKEAELSMLQRDQNESENLVQQYLDDDDDQSYKHQHRKRILYAEEDEQNQFDERRYLDAEQVKGRLTFWIQQVETIKYIKSKFIKFLTQFKGTNEYPIYIAKIRKMCIDNKQSIEISYEHLKQAIPTIAMWIGLQPALIIPELNVIVYTVAIKQYTSYKNIFAEVFVKIKDLPIMDKIRDLRYEHLGKLIKIKGVVTIRSEVFSQLKRVMYKCVRCGYLKGPYYLKTIEHIQLGQCGSCQSSGPYKIDHQKTFYRNYQKMQVQQSPSEVLPGRIPRSKEVILFGDNIDCAQPGQQIEVTGIYIHRYQCALNTRQGFPLFSTLIQTNSVVKCFDISSKYEDQVRQEKYIEFSKNKNLANKIYQSIAPSIYGHQQVKKTLALALFGGVEKIVENTHRIRGDINVLLLGDPGTAKSQMLKSLQKVFDRCVYTTGKGASAVGLTASVKKDYSTNQWKLQAGALVLADRGLCLIDEFDKMNQQDRTSIHEAMQQQSISISKAGIVTTLRARCSIIAAANPLQGRYNSQLSFNQNVDLTTPILSRFDVLNVIKDTVNEEIDYNLSTFVINSHIKNHPYLNKYSIQYEQLPQKQKQSEINYEFLKGYIRYCRQKCRPELPSKNLQIIKQFYITLREDSKNTSGMNIAVRHIQSLIRLATAHAKMHLRLQVSKIDIDIAISIILNSFIQTQKYSVAKLILKKYSHYLQ